MIKVYDICICSDKAEAKDIKECVLFYEEIQYEIRIYFNNGTKRIRPLEFLDFLCGDSGLIKGDAVQAVAILPKSIFLAQMSNLEVADFMGFLEARTRAYFEDCDWINAGEYSKDNETLLLALPDYRKQKIPWAYVKSTDIVAPGESFVIKMLENETGLRIEAGPDRYIMIGCRGEVYDIDRNKFENTYDATDEQFDIFEQLTDMIPEAGIEATGEIISIDTFARLCYPKPVSQIKAKALNRRTKIFPVGNEDYFLGKAGDYMAVRKDDLSDIYIIRKNFFEMTYEAEE